MVGTKELCGGDQTQRNATQARQILQALIWRVSTCTSTHGGSWQWYPSLTWPIPSPYLAGWTTTRTWRRLLCIDVTSSRMRGGGGGSWMESELRSRVPRRPRVLRWPLRFIHGAHAQRSAAPPPQRHCRRREHDEWMDALTRWGGCVRACVRAGIWHAAVLMNGQSRGRDPTCVGIGQVEWRRTWRNVCPEKGNSFSWVFFESTL